MPTAPGTTANAPAYDLDLEDARPQLAGDEEAIAFGVVGDAVEHVDACLFARIEQAVQIDPGSDPAGRGGDDRDALALPDVREDLTFHVFELVEPRHRPPAVLDDQRADLPQRLGIDQAKRAAVGAVAHDQAGAVMREAPAFTGVPEGALLLERLPVVDEPE